MDRPLLEDSLLDGRILFDRLRIPLPKAAPFTFLRVDIAVKDGDTLTVAGHELTFLHPPRHTRGSMAVIDRKLRLYMTGDTPNGRGDGRPNLTFNSAQYEASVRRLSSEPIGRLVLGHQFPPLNRAVLSDKEAKFISMESLSALRFQRKCGECDEGSEADHS